MSAKKAANHYGIPRSTIRSRLVLLKKLQTVFRPGPTTVLTQDEETELEEWVYDMQSRGFPVTKEMLLSNVKIFLDANPREHKFPQNMPGRTWVKLYLKRHPKMSLRTPEFVTKASATVSLSDIHSWYDKVELFLTKEGFMEILQDPRRIINGDETSFQLNPKNKTVFALRGSRNVYDVERTSSKLNITTMFSFFASGEAIPPTIIYPYKTIPKAVADSVPSMWGVAKSDTGWMTTPVFRDYIRNVLDPYLVAKKVKKPVMFIIDGHSSHINVETSKLCRQLGIVLIALYPNVTRIMQPADVSVFKPMKNAWPKAVQRFREKNPEGCVNAHNFATVLQDCLRNSVTVKTIKNGFRASGLYPWDRNAIDPSKCLGKSTVREDPEEPLFEPGDVEPTRESAETSAQLINAKRTLEECAAAIGETRVKKYKSQFVCLDNEEDAALFKIFSTLEQNYPDVFESLEDNVPENDPVCDFVYADINNATPDGNGVADGFESTPGEPSKMIADAANPGPSRTSSIKGAAGGLQATPEEPPKMVPETAKPGPSRTPLKDFLNRPPTPKRTAKREYKSKRYHVLTSDEFIQEFEQKEEDKRRAEEEKENRKVIRMQRKVEAETKKNKKQEEKKLKQDMKDKARKKKA
ncbi:uncharacterized protein LOC134224151 [Armigeres subalbatus]|uniref:uncharacterized protein LOC134224151 n=1 Tax=Armigeres subalbatus TaxID=124917 RepID=UPI002ED015EE